MQHILRHSSYYVSHVRQITHAYERLAEVHVLASQTALYILCMHIYMYVTFKLLGSNFKAISSHIFQKSIIELYQIPWMLHIQIYILTQLRLTHVHASFLRTKDTPCKTHMLLPDMISTVISLITIYSEYHIYRYNNILYMYIYV